MIRADAIRAAEALGELVLLASKEVINGSTDSASSNPFDAAVGVTDDTKQQGPVAPVISAEDAQRIQLALRKAAMEGRHNVFVEILQTVTGAITTIPGLLARLGIVL